MATTVSVRMYNVGFGDAFVVTVRRGRQAWRMLVDCGVHSQGRARPIEKVVDAIIADLNAEDPPHGPHLDVVVATHHHADHISGFACDAWETVSVGEVWVPFVEDLDDPDAKVLRETHQTATAKLAAMVERRAAALEGGPRPQSLAMAHAFALNSSGNAAATDRLLSRNGRRFATTPPVRYLPYVESGANVVPTGIDRVVVHVLGPSRDPDDLRRMNPPKSAGWLRLDGEGDDDDAALPALFDPVFATDGGRVPPDLLAVKDTLKLDDVTNDDGLLAAASLLERAVNNTSVFFVLDVDGTRLLFPGDAQQGAWDHVLDDPASLALVRDAKFYKIGHHGSHNATPKRYIEEILTNGAHAMLPWGLVEAWKATIPKTELMDALAEHKHVVTRADAPEAIDGVVTVHDDLWSEVTFTA